MFHTQLMARRTLVTGVYESPEYRWLVFTHHSLILVLQLTGFYFYFFLLTSILFSCRLIRISVNLFKIGYMISVKPFLLESVAPFFWRWHSKRALISSRIKA